LQRQPILPGRALISAEVAGLVRTTNNGHQADPVERPPVCRDDPSVELLFRSAARTRGRTRLASSCPAS
jgi:chemotaxis response regulator CheB